MRSSPVLAALLCFTTWMSTVHATHGPEFSCCRGWSNTRVHHNKILNYSIQSEGVCPIAAIVFWTETGKRICSDPNNDWAKRVILKVDNKRKALQVSGQNEEGSTSEITAAVSTTSKNAPRKKCRKGRRCQRKRARGGRKGQRKRA